MKKHLKIMSAAIAGIMAVAGGSVFANAKTMPVDTEQTCSICTLSECPESLPNCDNLKVLMNSGCCDILKDFECADIINVLQGGCAVTEPTVTTEPTECTTVAVTEPQTTEPVTELPSTEATESTTAVVTEPVVTVPATEVPTTETVEKETSEPSESTKPTSPSEFNQAYADEVIRLVNIEREKYGLPSLSKKADATQAAEIRSKEITQLFSHTRPDGTSLTTIAKELGISYRTIGENIAYGYSSPESVVEGWMNSQGHRENILSSSFNGIGVGCYESNGVLYWAQFFIGV